MAHINPYLTFNGICEEVFNFYKSVFGGEFAMLSRFKDLPAEFNMPESEHHKIMHISLPIGSVTLMGSDASEAYGQNVKIGNNFSIAYTTDSEQEARSIFERLATGGKVTMPLEKSFWAALFGMVTDKYGTQWMVTFEDSNQ